MSHLRHSHRAVCVAVRQETCEHPSSRERKPREGSHCACYRFAVRCVVPPVRSGRGTVAGRVVARCGGCSSPGKSVPRHRRPPAASREERITTAGGLGHLLPAEPGRGQHQLVKHPINMASRSPSIYVSCRTS
jgi:hypothetical protein